MIRPTFNTASGIFLAFFFVSNVVAQTVSVQVTEPEVSQQNKSIELTGTIESKYNADLAVQESGAIQELFVDLGSIVVKGQRLLQLDASLAKHRMSELEAALSAAEIEQAEAKRLYKEVVALSKTQVVAETLLAERKANLARSEAAFLSSKAELALQKEVVQRHTLIAPFSGVIARRNADIGEWVVPQTSVFNLVSNNELRLVVAFPQEFYQELKNAEATVEVMPDHDREMSLNLTLSEVVAVSETSTRTFVGLVELPKSDALIAGMSATARFNITGPSKSLIWLPRSAIKNHPDGGTSVFAVENNIAKRFIVKIEDRRDGLIAVSEVPSNLRYVLKGVELLKDGTSVTVEVVDGDSK